MFHFPFSPVATPPLPFIQENNQFDEFQKEEKDQYYTKLSAKFPFWIPFLIFFNYLHYINLHLHYFQSY